MKITHPFRRFGFLLPICAALGGFGHYALATELVPIFPIQGGTQLAIRPQGAMVFLEAYDSGINYYSEIRISTLDALGTNQSAFQGYTDAAFELGSPDIAVNETNGVAVYANYYAYVGDEGTYHKVRMFRFDTNGDPLTAISNVTEYALSQNFNGYYPIVRTDMNRAGQFAVVYFDMSARFQEPLYEEYIYVQLFNANGSPVGPARVVNQRLIAYWPVVAAAPDGGAVAVWEDASVDTYSYDAGHDIYARRIDSTGNPVGNEFRVNMTINGRHNDAEIAIATNGSFAIVWTRSSSDANGVYLQRFNADASRFGPELRVSPYSGTDPQVAMAADGRFIVAWQGPDGDGSGIFAQRFLADGSFYGNALWVNESAANSQSKPLLGLADGGTFIVKWTEYVTNFNNFARWIAWDATNQTQIRGPRVQSISPYSAAPSLTNLAVTFDRLMNPATFATTNAQLVDPVGRIIPVTSVQTTNNQTLALGFAGQQLPGRYYVEIASTIQDANGVPMDENGNTIGGESADAFRGNFTLTSSVAAAFPLTEGFESDPDALVGWSFDPAIIGGLVFSTNGAPHGGANHLQFTGGPVESAALTMNLSSQAGQTNLFLSFWAKQNSYLYQSGCFHVELSGDGQTWHSIPVTDPSANYTEYVVDLDQAAAMNGVALDGDFHIRFRYDFYISHYSVYLDDVRVMAGELPIGPKVLGLSPTQWAATNVTLNAATVTFDQPIDPATFTGADVALNSAQGFTVSNVTVLPVGGSGNTQFNVTFPDQTVRGVYQLIIGPDIADTNGHLMNQNGNAANGEPGDLNGEAADYYTGTIHFAPTAGTPVPGPIVFEETFENWGSVPTHWGFAPFRLGPGDARYPQFHGAFNSGGSMSASADSHRGGAALAANISGSYTTDAESITLALDLSGQTGQTNLFLEFWAKAITESGSAFGSLYLEASSDAQTWKQILSAGGPSSYTQFTVDLDQVLAANNISLSEAVYFLFRYVKPASVYSPNDGTLYLDDVRILAGDPSDLFPPTITAQPANQTGYAGFSAGFSVGAGGTATLAYQWQFNGTNLVGETNTSLALTNLQLAQAGNYRVLITNPYGTEYSRAASLTVLIPTSPTIATQPASRTAAVGADVSFSGTTSGGTQPLSYQWQKDGNPVAGATNLTMSLTNVQLADAGAYQMVVSNLLGTVTSAAATLTVTPSGPKIIGQSLTNWAGTNTFLRTFTVSFDKAIDPATFTAVDIVLRNPLGNIVSNVSVASVLGTGATQFALAFSAQTLRGGYQFTIGPNIADTDGQLMNQNGGGTNGEASDYYSGMVTYAAGAASVPFTEGFETGSVEALGSYWSFERTVGTMSATTNNPHTGTYGLQMDAPPIYLWDTGALWYQDATLHLDLAGRTNVVLDFWYKRCSGPDNWANVTVSVGNSLSVGLPGFDGRLSYNYEHYSYNLDALNIAYSHDVQIHFRSYGNWSGGVYAWDDIRARVADKRLDIARAANGQFAINFVPQPGLNYTVQYRDDLRTNTAWQALPAGPHNSGYLLVTNTAPQGFYRLLITSP